MNKITLRSGILLAVISFGACQTPHLSNQLVLSGSQVPLPSGKPPIWSSDAYTIYPDSVVQGRFVSRVASPTRLVSNYKSMAKESQSPLLAFKFSINGKDNEMFSGKDHQFICSGQNGPCETPLIKFGEQLKGDPTVPANTYLKTNTLLKIRLDMRHVMDAFKKQGYYIGFNGDKIYKEDFKGVYVAGGTAPMTWDFDNLTNFKNLELKDLEGDGIYEANLVLNPDKDNQVTASTWKISKDVSAFPQYKSDYPIVDALYNMALEEMVNAVEPDSTFRTGKEWAGVWTRDISYSIILSMAILQPRVARYSLMRKVKNGRIIQDTGTGGAYPASTDRIVWGVAAWELYKTTGDKNWLKEAFQIIRNSMDDDLKNAYNTQTGLFKGESSFLDWREQTYPEWMQPVDIYNSENLGTNAVFYQANRILSQMAKLLGDPIAVTKYSGIAEGVRKGINEHLWISEKGYYGQYLYGRNFKILSPKAEALGEALSVLFEVAGPEKQRSIVSNMPVTTFGIASIYPQIPNIPPYHNNGIWPFVQSYWALAAAKIGNEASLTESMSAIYRPAALWLTNKENFVATNGDYAGTQINSSNMLWSLAGNLSLIYKVLFGMDFQADKLVFKPMVPKTYQGHRQLSNFKYREAILDIQLDGFGNQIKTIMMDGQPMKNAEIPATLNGRHTIKIVLANQEMPAGGTNQVGVDFTPEIPIVSYAKGNLSWNVQKGVRYYRVFKNGLQVEKTDKTAMAVEEGDYAEYQVVAVDAKGYESFANEPVVVAPARNCQIIEAEKSAVIARLPYKGYSGNGFVEISKSKNKAIIFQVTVPVSGLYALDLRYANGEGPINTQNKCAIRTLKIGNRPAGTIVLPQRGTNEWSDWGFSNSIKVQLNKGTHHLTLSFEPANENMHGEINRAILDYLRVTKIKG